MNSPDGEGADQRVRLTKTAPQADQDSVHDLQVQVQMLTQHGKIPTRESAKQVRFDLCAANPSEVGPGCRTVVRLDVVFVIPTGAYAELQPRSGLA